MKKLSFLATMIVCLAFANNAKAAVIDFEDVDVSPDGYAILNDYADATWINFGVLDSVKYDPAYAAATSSGTQVAYNVNSADPSKILFNNPINIQSIHFASAYFEPNNVIVNWLHSNGITGTHTITLSTGSGQWEYPLLNDIVAFEFQSDNYFFGMDDITYTTTPAPEPATMTLGLMSLAGLLGMKKRNK